MEALIICSDWGFGKLFGDFDAAWAFSTGFPGRLEIFLEFLWKTRKNPLKSLHLSTMLSTIGVLLWINPQFF